MFANNSVVTMEITGIRYNHLNVARVLNRKKRFILDIDNQNIWYRHSDGAIRTCRVKVIEEGKNVSIVINTIDAFVYDYEAILDDRTLAHNSGDKYDIRAFNYVMRNLGKL